MPDKEKKKKTTMRLISFLAFWKLVDVRGTAHLDLEALETEEG